VRNLSVGEVSSDEQFLLSTRVYKKHNKRNNFAFENHIIVIIIIIIIIM